MNGMKLSAISCSILVLLLSACGGSSHDDGVAAGLPQLSPAVPGTLSQCASLASAFKYANTNLLSAAEAAAGSLTVAGKDAPAHCLITGEMYPREGVNGRYSIQFEMRLPKAWNGRFFYQTNGGFDGVVVPATGLPSGSASMTSALMQGFAVISSDGGHSAAQNAAGPLSFGNDPQARLDFGYQTVAKLTPMAKDLIKAAYGRSPDRSYIAGCSNGGRMTMVAAARFAPDFDGFLIGNPGFHLPLSATAGVSILQRYVKLTGSPATAPTAFNQTERAMVAKAILNRCDALDGANDAMVQDVSACQAAFDIQRDVSTCTGPRDGTCLTADQKNLVSDIFNGVKTSTGKLVYARYPFDNGLQSPAWDFWKLTAAASISSMGIAQVWRSPPVTAQSFNPVAFALTANLDDMLAGLNATSGDFKESGTSFMTPPNATQLGAVRDRGAKIMVYHGNGDPGFSSEDTAAWYDELSKQNNGEAKNFARFYRVPGMGHCSGGPATDQFDMISPLVDWVEKGVAPQAIIASVRGAGNAAGVNAELPADWSATRTRPLCVYPQVAKYKGSGSLEDAANFSCN